MNSVEVKGMMSFRRELRDVRSKFEKDVYWPKYGSWPSSYETTFAEVLRGREIVDLLREKPHPTVIDLLAPSRTLNVLFSILAQPGKLGIALSLEDLRSEALKDRDQALGIKQISGDITRPKTWKALRSALEGRKADLIMERADGGLRDMPKDKRFYFYALANLWNMLDENGGILILQTWSDGDTGILDWVNLLESKEIIAEFGGKCLKLVRTPKSPRDLPSAVGLPDRLPYTSTQTSKVRNNFQY